MHTTSSRPILTRRTSYSYGVDDVPALGCHLVAAGYTAHPSRSLVEYGRYGNGSALVVLYHSGAVSVQGSDPAPAHAVLAEILQAPARQEVLPC